MGRILAILLTTILLVGCGGGDNGGSRPPAPPPMNGPNQDKLTYLNDNALLLLSDMSIQASRSGQRTRWIANSECDVNGCTASNASFNLSQRFTTDDIVAEGESISEGLALVGAGSRNGIDLYRVSERVSIGDGYFDATGFGGWMRHSVFTSVAGDTTTQGTNTEIVYGLSIGNRSGGFPAVSATYNGVMLGVDIRPEQHGNQVRGDARVDFTLSRPNDPRVSVSFSNIDGGPVRMMNWPDISVGQNGIFDQVGITGSFYGPNHEEVGGTFTFNDVAGAYGAKR